MSAHDVTDETRMSAWDILRKGIALSPALREGIGVTLVLAALSTVGSSVVPIVIQVMIDKGFDNDVDRSQVWWYVAGAAAVVAITGACAYATKVRLFIASERGLAQLRVYAFRHVHDLSMLTQNSERRGSLVSRVTSDIDQVSLFVQFTGMMIVVSIGQMLVATVIMAWYSWQLTIVVWVCFIPLVVSLRYFQPRLSAAYDHVRYTVGEMLAVIAEPVVGASVVRAYNIEHRTQERIDEGIGNNLRANIRAQRLVAVTFAAAGVAGGLANAFVILLGVMLGIAGQLSVGTVIAFAFLVSLFVGPVQIATQVLTEAQNAIASWRRVIDLVETPADVVDPGERGVSLAHESLGADFDDVAFAYPGGTPVLRDIDVSIRPEERIAIVGETGSGKTTFAKLLTRLMDPTEGQVRVGGHDLRDISFASLRRRVVMVPQEGFLFDATLAANLRYGKRDATDEQLQAAIEQLELGDWLAGLPDGLETPVGERGEALSSGERQLVALTRAYLADPDLLVLDEATSAVDPQTEMRATRALERLLTGRTSVTIAHRLSTAEVADRILVFDAGRIVEDGPHASLVGNGGVYTRLHASWVAQSHLESASGHSLEP